MTNYELKNKLEIIANEREDSIEKEVAKEALTHNDIKAFFIEVIENGCSSGIVTSMIYYSDTHAFFDTYYNQIEELRSYFEDEMGGKIKIVGDLKNTLAWFAFEQVALEITNGLGIEI